MELTYVGDKFGMEDAKIEGIDYGSDRAWHFLALGLSAAVVGMLMVVVADLLLRASY